MSSSAERQRAYRAQRPFAGDNGERRLQAWVTTGTLLALGRLARHASTTQRAILEQLILAADQATQQGMSNADFEQYLSLPHNRR
mgnify:CR=1 FL=1